MTAQTKDAPEQDLAARNAELEERLAKLEQLVQDAPATAAQAPVAEGLEPEVVRWAERCGDVIGEDGRLTDDVQFRSRGRRFRAVTVAKRPVFDNHGVKVGETPGEVAEFAEGLLTTRDPIVVWSLMTRSSFNREFFRVGMEPDAVPDSQPVLDKLMKATIELDVGTIEEIQAAERDGDKRPDVLAFCETALRKIHGEYEEHIPR